MRCPPKSRQLDLFSSPSDATTAQMPHWPSLPEEARQALTQLMTRLFLDHAGGGPTAVGKEAGHDV